MTRELCKRNWEVEALEDGRLSEKDRASFERHLATCESCTGARERLRELAALLKATPTPEHTELEQRRARAALLGRANGSVVGQMARPVRWAFVVPLVAVAALALFLVQRFRHVPAPPAGSSSAVANAPVAPLFEVAEVGHADFSAEKVAGMSRVALRSGTASFHVEHVKPGARFLVAVPDGEVEVRGTRFVVEVAEGRTRSVVVTEGVVAVRVAGFEGELRAGERWPQALPSGPPPTSTSVASAPSSTASAPASPPSTRPTPGPRFAEAMASFNKGDYGEAERLFASFVRAFPGDSRTEDAMFLIADARARRGDASGAREAARAYLTRYPSGLRAPAATRLAGPAPAP